MSSPADYFKNIKVENIFVKKEDVQTLDPNSCKSKTWLGSIPKIPCKLKQFGSFVFNAYSNSWKLRFITLFLIILVCMNYYLIYTNQISSANLEGGMFINSVYFTTTQLSSVGFGDWTPSTGFAKMTTSLANVLVMFIAYSMAEEFGYMTVARLNQSEQIEKNIKKELEPIKITLTPEVKQDIKKSVENYIPNIINNIKDDSYMEKKVTGVSNKVEEAVNKFKTRKNAILPTLDETQNDLE
jgi:Ion channel